MKRQCYLCGKMALIRKYEAHCSECMKMYARMRIGVSSVINSSLKYVIKSYIWDFLPYSVSELKIHLQSQFEPWMSWQNRGRYIASKWNDSDVSTWVWQIDHIIPQSNFLFLSIGEVNFVDCWSLNNLRPLSAKENSIKHTKESMTIS